MERHREKFLSESVFVYETGPEDAYEVMDVMNIDLKDIEKEAANMRGAPRARAARPRRPAKPPGTAARHSR